ncbi:hypothetical protein Tsubulata_018231 [Turnera subulata]|uniref:SUZ domain-containing protein n=1 Tax=Turnera subulata TaxID=218843 RepID=A0A9Q0FVF5_9ROSI|nr:hypothetical protein Tsubulata_018231 [Turnera subulata]
MESSTQSPPTTNIKESTVDPFLLEALQSPRHRLTILRMELDIQRFLQNADSQQFEFQHYPSSYLRLAAHRVAQHYGLVTMVQDNGIDGMVNKIVVKKTAESRYPAVRLSEIPAKQLESDKSEQVKIVIRPRPNKGTMNGCNEHGFKQNPVRSVEERKEEYDKARARIFSGPGSSGADNTQAPGDKKGTGFGDEKENCRNIAVDPENYVSMRDGSSSRVAIFRDREKDRTDPDYDRSYERYVRNLPPNQSHSLLPFNMQNLQHPFFQYETGFPQSSQMAKIQPSMGHGPPASSVMSPFCAMGSNQTAMDAAYVQWPSAMLMYTHSYEQFRHGAFQAQFCQQPLSFDYSQNH